MSERILLLADAHLQPGERPEQNRDLARLLDRAAGEVAEMVLLGDCFHCWFERRGRVVGDYEPVLSLFAGAAERGLRIRHISGNRDFAIGGGRTDEKDATDDADPWERNAPYPGFFSIAGDRSPSVLNRYGIEPCGLSLRLRQGGRRILLIHGDVYCTRDYAYRAMRWLTQGPLGRIAMAWGPFWIARLAVGFVQGRLRLPGRQYLGPEKGMVWADVSRELSRGADLVVCGHFHHYGRRPLLWGDKEGELVILPAWRFGGEYGVLEGGGVRLAGGDSE